MVNIMKIHTSFYNELTIEELYTHFMSVEPQNLIFNSPSTSTDNFYMNLNDSIEVLEKLIFYQCYNNTEQVDYFFNCLFEVIDKKIIKKKYYFYFISSKCR